MVKVAMSIILSIYLILMWYLNGLKKFCQRNRQRRRLLMELNWSIYFIKKKKRGDIQHFENQVEYKQEFQRLSI